MLDRGRRRSEQVRRHSQLPPAIDDFAETLGPYLSHLWGRSVVIHVRDVAMAAAASIDLDGQSHCAVSAG